MGPGSGTGERRPADGGRFGAVPAAVAAGLRRRMRRAGRSGPGPARAAPCGVPARPRPGAARVRRPERGTNPRAGSAATAGRPQATSLGGVTRAARHGRAAGAKPQEPTPGPCEAGGRDFGHRAGQTGRRIERPPHAPPTTLVPPRWRGRGDGKTACGTGKRVARREPPGARPTRRPDQHCEGDQSHGRRRERQDSSRPGRDRPPEVKRTARSVRTFPPARTATDLVRPARYIPQGCRDARTRSAENRGGPAGPLGEGGRADRPSPQPPTGRRPPTEPPSGAGARRGKPHGRVGRRARVRTRG